MTEKTRCCVCNRQGRRKCPALDGMICTSCCGAKRGSSIDCPPHCLYFPFGTEAYDAWLKIDSTWMPKVIRYILDHVDKTHFENILRRMDSDNVPSPESMEMSFPAAAHYFLGVERDADEKTIADIWEEEGWQGLNNDERVMIKYRRNTLPTIIEVQNVLGDHAMECIDLFDPNGSPFIMFDRSLAQNADRFTRFLMWITHYLHFSRPEGVGFVVPFLIFDEFYDEILTRACGKSKNFRASDVKGYLAGHFGECCALLKTMTRDNTKRMIRSIDMHHGVAVYEIKGSREDIKAIIESKPEFTFDDRELEPDDPEGTEYYNWLRRGESKKIEASMHPSFSHEDESQGVGILGSLKLCPDQMIIEMFSKKKFEFAKEMVKKYFGSHVNFSRESVEDLSKQAAKRIKKMEREPSDKDEEKQAGTIPMEMEVEQQVMEQFYREHYTKFLDDSIPALSGMNPREAAKNPVMRPQLIELMKNHVHTFSTMCRQKGLKLEIDWVLEELGLHELL